MRIITLMYHDVYNRNESSATGFTESGADSYKLSRADFSDHLQALQAGGGRAVTVLEAVASRQTQTFMLTFDDGGVSALTEIVPLLDKLVWPGHFFITTERIGTIGFLSRDDIELLHTGGHIVGSHSHTHPDIISSLSDEELTEEWQRSVTILAEITGSPITIASVPGGFLSRRVARAAAAAGIRYLFTSDPGQRTRDIAGCQLFPRYTLKQDMNGGIAAGLVYSHGNWRQRQYMSWNSRKLMKKVSGPLYLRIWKWLHRREEHS
jgi:peptidoglycan/xylan/chitin deacetylase (PgdA/CDA1 family)